MKNGFASSGRGFGLERSDSQNRELYYSLLCNLHFVRPDVYLWSVDDCWRRYAATAARDEDDDVGDEMGFAFEVHNIYSRISRLSPDPGSPSAPRLTAVLVLLEMYANKCEPKSHTYHMQICRILLKIHGIRSVELEAGESISREECADKREGLRGYYMELTNDDLQGWW